MLESADPQAEETSRQRQNPRLLTHVPYGSSQPVRRPPWECESGFCAFRMRSAGHELAQLADRAACRDRRLVEAFSRPFLQGHRQLDAIERLQAKFVQCGQVGSGLTACESRQPLLEVTARRRQLLW